MDTREGGPSLGADREGQPGRHGREPARRVDKRADETCVKEARVLSSLCPPRHGDFDFAGLSADNLDAAPLIEGGGLVDRTHLS